eukprot:1602577-Rhodomonas_salina.1
MALCLAPLSRPHVMMAALVESSDQCNRARSIMIRPLHSLSLVPLQKRRPVLIPSHLPRVPLQEGRQE